MTPFLDAECLRRVDVEAFRVRAPFPWAGLGGVLTEDGFSTLRDTFPPIDWFERHEGRPNPRAPRPHDRHHLACGASIYHPFRAPARGEVSRAALPETWRRFLAELESGAYRSFLAALLGDDDWELRYAWHLGSTRSEVSPHRDADEKRATHVFYFNTPDDWSPEWGGETLVLGGPRRGAERPDFDDFETAVAVPFLGNRSFVFANGPQAWHGVRPIHPPPGRHRRLFNVVVSRRPPRWRRLARRAVWIVRRSV